MLKSNWPTPREENIKRGEKWGLRQHNLRKNFIRNTSFSDSILAINDDLDTELVYIILMTDATVRVNLLAL